MLVHAQELVYTLKDLMPLVWSGYSTWNVLLAHTLSNYLPHSSLDKTLNSAISFKRLG